MRTSTNPVPTPSEGDCRLVVDSSGPPISPGSTASSDVVLRSARPALLATLAVPAAAGAAAVVGTAAGLDPGFRWEPVALAALAGALAGAASRRLLTRLPRGTPVSPGWSEIPTALLWSLVAIRWATGGLPIWWVPTALALTWLAVPLVLVDSRCRRLPDALTLPAYPLFACTLVPAAITGGGTRLAVAAVVGSLVFIGLHWAIAAVWRGSLGAGDVKLAGSLGAVLGPVGLFALPLAMLGASLATLGLYMCAPRRWRVGIPHGPGMLAAACLIVLFPGAV